MVIASLLALGGCASKPDAAVRMRVEASAPLHAPAAAVTAAGGGLVLDVDGVAVDTIPDGTSITSIANLITGPVNEPKPSTSAADRIVLLPADLSPGPHADEPAGPASRQSARLFIPTGWTGHVWLTGPIPEDKSSGLSVFITAPSAADKPVLRFACEGAAEDEETAEGKPAPARPGGMQTITLGWPLEETAGTFTIGVAAGSVLGSPRSTIWRFKVTDAAGDPDASSSIRELVKETSEAKASRGDSPWVGTARALRTAPTPERCRGVLAVAALGLNADLCAEVASLAEPKELAALSTAVADAMDGLAPEADVVAAAWAVDRAAIAWLAGLRASGALTDTLASTLSARFGEVGRDPATLGDLAARSSSGDDFRHRLIAEHLILLDDLAPGVRVRSYDWLASLSAAPPGYDALGPARERRAAIEKHLESMAKPPQ